MPADGDLFINATIFKNLTFAHSKFGIDVYNSPPRPISLVCTLNENFRGYVTEYGT